jgi:hypothetical protein
MITMKTVNLKTGNNNHIKKIRQCVFTKSGAEPEKLTSRENFNKLFYELVF